MLEAALLVYAATPDNFGGHNPLGFRALGASQSPAQTMQSEEIVPHKEAGELIRVTAIFDDQLLGKKPHRCMAEESEPQGIVFARRQIFIKRPYLLPETTG